MLILQDPHVYDGHHPYFITLYSDENWKYKNAKFNVCLTPINIFILKKKLPPRKITLNYILK